MGPLWEIKTCPRIRSRDQTMNSAASRQPPYLDFNRLFRVSHGLEEPSYLRVAEHLVADNDIAAAAFLLYPCRYVDRGAEVVETDQRQSKLPTNDNQNSRCLNKVLPGQVVDFARCLDGNRSTSETTDEADTKGSDTGPCSVESGNG